MQEPEAHPVDVNDLSEMPAPTVRKSWRSYGERMEYSFGLGFAVRFQGGFDAHLALGWWAVGVEYREQT